jgi:hypothetical protein
MGCSSLRPSCWFESISRQPSRAFKNNSPSRPLTRSSLIGVRPSGGLVPKIVATAAAPAGLRQWRTVAGARCSPQATDRGNRKSTRARRSWRKLECRARCLAVRQKRAGGTRPAFGSRAGPRPCPGRKPPPASGIPALFYRRGCPTRAAGPNATAARCASPQRFDRQTHGSLLTRRWREMDSNLRFPAREVVISAFAKWNGSR